MLFCYNETVRIKFSRKDIFKMSKSTRHPCINYWFWTEETLKDKRYIKTIDRIASESSFNLITLTDRGCDFWDYSHKPIFCVKIE